MNFVRKVEIFSFDFNQEGGELLVEKPNNIKDKYKLKITNILKIMSKLAAINAYDAEGNIRDENGNFIQNTDIAALLLHVMSPGKILHGEDKFIELLKEAKITHHLIFNESIKKKLEFNYSQNFFHHETEPIIIAETPPEIKYEPVISRAPLKRKIENEDDEPAMKRSFSRKKMEDEDGEPVIRHAPFKRKIEDEIDKIHKRPKMEGFGILKWTIPKKY